ncbi:MAG: DinB superfamily [Chloroflexota bacterium]|jgi:uncharacterized protein (TIGR03083 family)|nr:DinB superfamily [Chloroflexota bacterium]
MADRRATLRQALTDAHDELNATLDSFQADDWRKLSPNEGWTAKDTLAHLASIQPRQRGNIGCILEGTPFPTEDVNSYNDRMVAERQNQTAEELRAELAEDLRATLAVLDKVQEADLDRWADRPGRGPQSVEGVFQQVANHMLTHARDIAAAKGTV